MPEPESAQVKVTVTFELFQPLAFGTGKALAVIVGGVRSILIVSAALAVFPALSVQVAVTGVVPSVESVMGEGFPVAPESASVQVNVTVTGDLFQPAALGSGEGEAVMTGGVLSIFRITQTVAVFPEVSVTVPQTD